MAQDRFGSGDMGGGEQLGIVVEVTDEGVRCRVPDGSSVSVDRDSYVDIDQPQLNQVVKLHSDEASVILGPGPAGLEAVPCTKVRPRRRDGLVRFEAAQGGNNRPALDKTHADLGVEDSEAGKLQKYKYNRRARDKEHFLLLVDGSGRATDLFWPKTLTEIRADLDAVREAEKKEKARKAVTAARRRAVRDDVFVNPYTYVPFPDEPSLRGKPAGHHRLGPDQLCGWIDVDIQTRTPLLIRYPADGDHWVFPRRDGQPFIPGSSLKGAVRSLHEALTGSCLRVVDQDHVPAYRDKVKARPRNWTLARVAEVDADGRITQAELCDDHAWVPVEALHEVLGGPENTRTGARVDIDAENIGNPSRASGRNQSGATHQRKVARDLSPGDSWVILVTATDARPATRPARRDSGEASTACPGGRRNASWERQPYYFAAGHLSGEQMPVTNEAWTTYLRAVEGTDDLRRARQKVRSDAEGGSLTEPRNEPVFHQDTSQGKERLGYRRTAAKGFAAGDVVWVRKGSRGIEEIALSYVWRTAGTGRVEERVHCDFLPCDDPATLCPSCRVFGMADTSGDRPGDRGQGEGTRQQAYAGHVRFGDAFPLHPEQPLTLRKIGLAPLGQPRLSVGQFSLRTSGEDDRKAGSPPTRYWGAAPDQGTSGFRQLRGQRMYWHGDPADQEVPRHQPRTHHRQGSEQSDREGEKQSDQERENRMLTKVEVVDPGATFRARVHFSGLTRAELGGLLAALRPAALLDDHRPPGFSDEGEVASRVGGGKPFGFGTVSTSFPNLHIEDAGSRYGQTNAQPDLTEEQAVTAFRHDMSDLQSDIRETVWPALAAVLHTGQVNPERIWYPPGATWDEAGSEAFDMPYAFFKYSAGDKDANSGRGKADGPRPAGWGDEETHPGGLMIVLPEPAEADQSLEIIQVDPVHRPDTTGA